MSKQRRVIKVETHKLFVVRSIQEDSVNVWCDECRLTVRMVTPERAALLTQTPPRIIYRKVENGELHFVETEDGLLLICCDSLRTITTLLSKGKSNQ